jgi:hypothetical protein
MPEQPKKKELRKEELGNAQLIVLIVLAVLLAAGYFALDMYSGGQKDMLTVETRGTSMIQGLAKHKVDTGNYPDVLEKLAPKYIAAVPNCPNGERISYKLSGNEYTLACSKVMFGKPYGYDSRVKAWSS